MAVQLCTNGFKMALKWLRNNGALKNGCAIAMKRQKMVCEKQMQKATKLQ